MIVSSRVDSEYISKRLSKQRLPYSYCDASVNTTVAVRNLYPGYFEVSNSLTHHWTPSINHFCRNYCNSINTVSNYPKQTGYTFYIASVDVACSCLWSSYDNLRWVGKVIRERLQCLKGVVCCGRVEGPLIHPNYARKKIHVGLPQLTTEGSVSYNSWKESVVLSMSPTADDPLHVIQITQTQNAEWYSVFFIKPGNIVGIEKVRWVWV